MPIFTVCKRATLLVFLVSGLWAMAPAASSAQTLYASLGLPVTAQSDGDSLENLSGVRVGFGTFLLPVSLTFSQYGGTRKEAVAVDPSESTLADADISHQLFGVFWNLPVPIVDLGLGLGFGSASIEVKDELDLLTSGTPYQDASLLAYSAYVGVPVFPPLSVYFAYEVVQGEAKRGSADLVPDTLSVSGNVGYLGVRAGF